MHKRLLIGSGVAVAIILLAIALSPSEPVYRSKPLSHWIKHLSGDGFSESFEAVRAIGPRAVPWLLGQVRAVHSPTHKLYGVIWTMLPGKAQAMLPIPDDFRKVEDMVDHTLFIVGSQGSPNLVASFRDRNNHVRRVAAHAMRRIDLNEKYLLDAVLGLSELLADPDDSVRLAALQTLKRMGPDARTAVPALIRAIESGNSGTVGSIALATESAQILGRIGSEAKRATAPLRELLDGPDQGLRSTAAVALWRINQDTNIAVVLTAGLEQTWFPFPSDILSVLGEMGPAAKDATPVILRKLHDPQEFVSDTDLGVVLEALTRIDPKAAAEAKASPNRERVAAYIESRRRDGRSTGAQKFAP